MTSFQEAAAAAAGTTVTTAMLNQPSFWLRVCKKAAPLSSIALYMAPIPTIIDITSKQSIGTLPLVPYTSMLSNNLIWLAYGITKNEYTIMFASSIGLFLSVLYFVQYIRLVPTTINTSTTTPKPPTSVRRSLSTAAAPSTSSITMIQRHIQFVSILTGSVVLALIFALFTVPKSLSSLLFTSDSDSMSSSLSNTSIRTLITQILGKAGVIFTMIMFASPLSTLQNVIATQSSTSIPFLVTIASLFNNSFWGTVGLFDMKDANIYIPAIVGLALSLIQLGVKVLYMNGPQRQQQQQQIPPTATNKMVQQRRSKRE